jgi:AcrR family transcriptional regulator
VGRRNLHKKEELKELILSAAYDIIKDEGFKGITARNIATKIGYTAGTLYHIFESLDDIVIHLKARALDKFESTFRTHFAKQENTFSIDTFFSFYINYCLNSHQDWLLLSERLLGKESLPSWYQEKVVNLFKFMVMNVAEATSSSYQKANRLTKLMWAAAQGLCTLSLEGQLELVNEHDLHSLQNDFAKYFDIFVQEETTVSA